MGYGEFPYDVVGEESTAAAKKKKKKVMMEEATINYF